VRLPRKGGKAGPDARLRILKAGAASSTRQIRRRIVMGDRVYKKIELVGTSTSSIDDAIRNAISTASATIKHMDWFEVSEMRGHITDGEVAHFQVVLKIGFRLER
jgi:dodecin